MYIMDPDTSIPLKDGNDAAESNIISEKISGELIDELSELLEIGYILDSSSDIFEDAVSQTPVAARKYYDGNDYN